MGERFFITWGIAFLIVVGWGVILYICVIFDQKWTNEKRLKIKDNAGKVIPNEALEHIVKLGKLHMGEMADITLNLKRLEQLKDPKYQINNIKEAHQKESSKKLPINVQKDDIQQNAEQEQQKQQHNKQNDSMYEADKYKENTSKMVEKER